MEQFSEEWEWVSALPITVNPPLKTAGKYSALTNLYQFALVMTCLITQVYTSAKPLQGTIKIPNPLNMSDPRKVVSYGAHILHPRYDRVDPALRQLVAECLCDEVMERPPLDRLLVYINASLQGRANSWVGEDSAAEVQVWVARHTGMPPAVPVAPVPAHWVHL
ncbi:hypothetical protein C8A05DRAFT_39075 [Staphylotrichum tortipilum]|uniref:Protein kinase domain-containing protein n=1 Tax=Staphylotrichum tortipilum TaxID=2831512 RepID=A0AAN6MAW5_9PEZI|nr:hypothetical protein C8A05DRAFT_39075 [Staphylotrichum longicolle]